MRMAPLPAKPDMKDRILETADRLFYLQGIRAIGVDTIAAEIGITKRTLYNHFPSKDALISAYLARRFVSRGHRTSRRSSRFSGLSIRWSGVSRPRIFAAAVSSTRWPNSAKIARCGRSPSTSRKAAVSGFATCWCSSASRMPEALATQLAMLVDGSIAQNMVRDDPAMARAAKQAATMLLRNAGVKVGGSVAANKRVVKKRLPRPPS